MDNKVVITVKDGNVDVNAGDYDKAELLDLLLVSSIRIASTELTMEQILKLVTYKYESYGDLPIEKSEG
ncbi:hypothetical protein [Levilactobacillus brevis]|uniref:hypothetical protein n=1 Tax=Levilactobacillus brevis TaxID=1580 RepID=UPI0025A248F8|nr:hypothetical protein [Levilactobacillus brevis]MDM7552952.1 hypothetical protein [Levilactobacillus brevis]MDM7649698.1 hypothetical protein [Levilactobacillus brevis]